jgi:hypothetical protein
MYFGPGTHPSRGAPSTVHCGSKYLKQCVKKPGTHGLARSMLIHGQASKRQTERIMSTYTKNLMAGNGLMVGMGFAPVFARKGHAVTAAKRGAQIGKRVKNVALFFAAPFIGLAYLLAFPLIGFALLAWIAAKAVMKSDKARPVAMVIAAPFIGLAFVTVGPIVGLGALAWYGGKALLKA